MRDSQGGGGGIVTRGNSGSTERGNEKGVEISIERRCGGNRVFARCNIKASWSNVHVEIQTRYGIYGVRIFRPRLCPTWLRPVPHQEGGNQGESIFLMRLRFDR